MMIQTPKAYHQTTGYDRYAMEPHAMDWANQPDPYKSYSGLDGVELPEVQDLFEVDLKSVYTGGDVNKTPAPLNPDTLSKICLLANGLTARSRQGDGYFYFRSAPSAGALYPNEMYFAGWGCQNLSSGIYHCGVHNRLLTRLREGNFKKHFQAAVPGTSEDLCGVFIVTGIFFRSAWKYRKRAYRYVLLDGGHLAENLRLAISAAGYQWRLHYGFDDREVDTLLGVDERREGSICCVSISGSTLLETDTGVNVEPLPQSFKSASRVSAAEIAYPEITGIHEASKSVAASGLKTLGMLSGLGISPPDGYTTVVDDEINTTVLNYPSTVFNRRSKRNFIPTPIDHDQLNYMLSLLCNVYAPITDNDPETGLSSAIGFIAGNVNGINPGFYLLDPVSHQFGRVFSGNLIEKMTRICLDQAWLKYAAIHFVFMSNLEILEKKWGARGYRCAMMTAGRFGHAVYLGATASGLGACGIGALYDNEARQLLGLNDDSALLYLVASGRTK